MKGYTTKADLELFLNEDTELSDFEFDRMASEIERYIDQYTQRNFKADVIPTARLYDGNDTTKLNIDDCVEITKVEIGNDGYGGSFQEISPINSSNASGYFTLPIEKDNAGNDRPINQIVMTSQRFLLGIKNQRITAKWGYSKNVPDDMRLATTILLAGAVNSNKGGIGGRITSEKIGSYSVTYDGRSTNLSWSDFEKAISILDNYKKWSL